AIQDGRFAREIAAVTISVKGQPTVVDRDEHPRGDTTLEMLRKLPPVFGNVEGQPGIITAGTSSGITDGGAALVLASEATARDRAGPPDRLHRRAPRRHAAARARTARRVARAGDAVRQRRPGHGVRNPKDRVIG